MNSLSQGDGKVPPIVNRLLAKLKPLTLLMLVGTVVFIQQATTNPSLVSLPMRISENSLLAGIVKETFADSSKLNRLQRGLFAKRSDDIHGFIAEELTKSGVEVYKQEFRSTLKQYKQFQGTTVYGIVPAFRSASVEAIIVAVKVDPEAYESIAVTLALAAHCREQIYWARNIVFVFVENEVGMEAWLSAYHGLKHQFLQFNTIEKHAGAIVGGVVMDFQGFGEKLNINVNMMNGRLPNLDLVNTIIRLSGKYNIHPTVYNRTNADDPTVTAGIAVYSQAFLELEGIHSVFGDYGIQVVGVETRGPRKGADHTHNLLRLAQIHEGVLRALNNILEKLHQSYFMYVLLGTDLFLSIAYFMIPIGTLLLPLLIFAIREWLQMKTFSFPPVVLITHVVGFGLAISAAPLFSRTYSEDVLFYSAAALMVPFSLLFKSTEDQLKTLKFLIYLEGPLVGASLSLLNFGLGFIVSTVIVIATLISTNVKRKPLSYLKSLIVISLHPFALAAAFMIYVNGTDPSTVIPELLKVLNHVVYTYMIHNSSLLLLLCAFAVPFWNLLVYVDLKSTED
ncbi:hypothetical protein L596_007989 [Steinernema carpocapsae]|uniref:Uncharacterized protein n=1 Tax=Steinernema carpocapsae TaxID=34508 RepID=A0A4U5PB70_STECR|nr:hypothetical protein L596_007989 [Steinernema carpocapsae]